MFFYFCSSTSSLYPDLSFFVASSSSLSQVLLQRLRISLGKVFILLRRCMCSRASFFLRTFIKFHFIKFYLFIYSRLITAVFTIWKAWQEASVWDFCLRRSFGRFDPQYRHCLLYHYQTLLFIIIHFVFSLKYAVINDFFNNKKLSKFNLRYWSRGCFKPHAI